MNLFSDHWLKLSPPTSLHKRISLLPIQNLGISLAKSIQNVAPDPSVYGSHSFRSGGASRAAYSGVSNRLFQRHGRRKSAAAKNGYIKDDISSQLSVSKSLGL